MWLTKREKSGLAGRRGFPRHQFLHMPLDGVEQIEERHASFVEPHVSPAFQRVANLRGVTARELDLTAGNLGGAEDRILRGSEGSEHLLDTNALDRAAAPRAKP